MTIYPDFLQEMDFRAECLRGMIRAAADQLNIQGTIYYVSQDGCDENDGKSRESAWKSLKKVSEAPLLPGDGVLFRRGDLFRGMVKTRPGVAYGAYGQGKKPRLYGWDKDLADPDLWEIWDAEYHIWKMKEKILDPGTLVFNEGKRHSYKLIPSYIGGKFVCRNDESRLFDMAEEMQRDLDIFWYFDDILTTTPSKGMDFPIPEMGEKSLGDLYLRCDQGNPGEIFASVEALPRRPMFQVGNDENVRIDNLCLKYIGLHAIAAGGHVKGLHVTNCEIGWIGGTIQHYFGTDPNYPQGGRGTVTRFGNGVEIYGGCEDYLVSHCHIYQCYDAGITHQITTNGKKYTMEKVRYEKNLVENCVYAIEYFLDMNQGDQQSYMDDILMQGNILRNSGYGWGQQRHNTDTPALIKGWSYVNNAKNYRVKENIFDRCAYRMLHLVAQKQESCPDMDGNIYIQHRGGMLGQYGGKEQGEPPILYFDEKIEKTIRETLGDQNAKICILEETE